MNPNTPATLRNMLIVFNHAIGAVNGAGGTPDPVIVQQRDAVADALHYIEEPRRNQYGGPWFVGWEDGLGLRHTESCRNATDAAAYAVSVLENDDHRLLFLVGPTTELNWLSGLIDPEVVSVSNWVLLCQWLADVQMDKVLSDVVADEPA